ncbi:GNAT family N-acetyltransferase [Brevibacillus sp. TJ4]|uniref:GNAT family N-acetyltransferase n=1 Tax=Brevibacillus sp. TJ4 TaxID=3234853 RepID=UPI003B9F5B71
MEFFELDQNRLAILEQWFTDHEVAQRLNGMLPLQEWFDYVQRNPDYFSWMVYVDSQPVGNIDLERYTDGTASVSLLTNPSLRNQGYGKRMIDALLKRPELSSVETIEIGIEQDNIASIKCFRKAGFIEHGLDEDGFVLLTYPLK